MPALREKLIPRLSECAPGCKKHDGRVDFSYYHRKTCRLYKISKLIVRTSFLLSSLSTFHSNRFHNLLALKKFFVEMAEMELPPVRAGHIFSVQRISSVFVINPHKPMRHIVLDEEAFPGLAPEKVDCGDYIARYSVVLRIVLDWLIAKKTPPDWNVGGC